MKNENIGTIKNKKLIIVVVSIAIIVTVSDFLIINSNNDLIEVKKDIVQVELGTAVSLYPAVYFYMNPKVNPKDVKVSFSQKDTKDVKVANYELTFKYNDEVDKVKVAVTVNKEVSDTTTGSTTNKLSMGPTLQNQLPLSQSQNLQHQHQLHNQK